MLLNIVIGAEDLKKKKTTFDSVALNGTTN